MAAAPTTTSPRVTRTSSRVTKGVRELDPDFQYRQVKKMEDHPFVELVGKEIEIHLGTTLGWQNGKVVEFHPFDGMHLVEMADGTKRLFHLDQREIRLKGRKREYTRLKEQVHKHPMHTRSQDPAPKSKRAKATADADGSKTATSPTGSASSSPAASQASAAAASDAGIDVGASTTQADKSKASHAHNHASNAIHVCYTDPEVDEMTGLKGQAEVLIDANHQVFEADLVYLDLSQNHDKYYKLQVLKAKDGSAYWCSHHWGRTGTHGQSQVFKFDDEATAIADFEDKFHQKTGFQWKDRDTASRKPGKYALKRKVYLSVGANPANSTGTNAAAGESVVWQYYVDDFVDGKSVGWYPYTESATRVVEGVYSEWQNNTWLDVRQVQSGYFSYRVDFNTMTQTNTSTNTCRRIRRQAQAA
ncbi:uncharacterized protein MONBRDRAFT_26587 [Monosiga brevicollis MX1]|uniref:NAD(+) ADP-ribosyltransferase n=1 Tax=Monosiga brevicollis TaxID=81824 RepID=A9V2T1_MONBE|nr:uncharacterized protein MONBRDRAFT_26587 [Monosiga brevicollis MX1]EDQ87939.1 predicted protein [Monosiga brevicollis MX1]|eukprot:XP_001747015.1 hypothetical protein [Monosiga brevicollis MX1]